MASFCGKSILRRTVLNSNARISSGTHRQRRNAQVLRNTIASTLHPGRFLQTLSGDGSNPVVVEKYREKLERKMKSEGVKSYKELREVYKERIEAIKKEDPLPGLPAELLADEPGSTQQTPPQTYNSIIPSPRAPTPPPTTTITSLPSSITFDAPPPPGVKTLSSFIDIPLLLRHEDPTEIEFIWRARHIKDPKSLCAVIPHSTYLRLEANARLHPMFILPLPRAISNPNGTGGVDMHFMQWTFPHKDTATVLFTSLAAYKLHGEFAVPHTTITHHGEIAVEKGVVFLQGQVVPDKGVNVEEARWLVMALQKFYGASRGGEDTENGARRLRLLERFTRGSGEFRIEDLIREAETF